MKDYMDFRDVVHATQHQMLKKFNESIISNAIAIEINDSVNEISDTSNLLSLRECLNDKS